MMIVVHCSKCGKELEGSGALVFSPPTCDMVRKYHICRKCWEELREMILDE